MPFRSVIPIYMHQELPWGIIRCATRYFWCRASSFWSELGRHILQVLPYSA